MSCPDCAKKEARIAELEDDIELYGDGRRLHAIAAEYAEILAEQGRIPNTPAGKRGFIMGRIVAS